jgi:hypothetical protein
MAVFNGVHPIAGEDAFRGFPDPDSALAQRFRQGIYLLGL